jgi:UDP-N-acetylmuramate dehydrogenase
MNNQRPFSLKSCNSFAIDSIAEQVVFIKNINDLHALAHLIQNKKHQNAFEDFYILGEGSNTLFIDPYISLIIKPEMKGINIEETDTSYIVKVAASENWHNLVLTLIEQGIYGLENLALIPGSVGAAPVQNIGAYGVELSTYCRSITWFDFHLIESQEISASDCQFSYRDSIFKHELKNKGLITQVTFEFSKQWQAQLSYQGLSTISLPITAKKVMDKVIDIRRSKLPDPAIIPNAGSFFKNPIVSIDIFNQLITRYPNMPFYQQSTQSVKLAAGWLIDQCGLKGYQLNNVAVHDKQALVLVNNLQGNGQHVVELARLVKNEVFNKFNVTLQPEVRFVSHHGEVNADEILING